MNNLEIQLFGSFKKYIPSGRICISLEQPTSVYRFKQQIADTIFEMNSNFREATLIFESALATEKCILFDDEVVDGTMSLALLPPVCGG